jgi:flagella basal body P-ring formation protein FlgA
VVRRDVASGAALTADDLMAAEVDWAAEPSPVLATPQQWLGQVALRALSTGQTLRQNMVRPAQVFQAGASVRVVAQGTGFQIASEGQALGAGVIGQVVKVRMDNGRIMSGIVLDARTVKMDM